MAEQYIPTELGKVVDLLESWADGQILPMNDLYGICYNLSRRDVTIRWEGLVAIAAESWPEFSGSHSYPVPHSDLLPESAYTAKWEVEKWDGEYGESRRRLCQHVADWIRENPARAEQILCWR